MRTSVLAPMILLFGIGLAQAEPVPSPKNPAAGRKTLDSLQQELAQVKVQLAAMTRE